MPVYYFDRCSVLPQTSYSFRVYDRHVFSAGLCRDFSNLCMAETVRFQPCKYLFE